MLLAEDNLLVGNTTIYPTTYRRSKEDLPPQIHPSKHHRSGDRVATVAPTGLACIYTRFRCT